MMISRLVLSTALVLGLSAMPALAKNKTPRPVTDETPPVTEVEPEPVVGNSVTEPEPVEEEGLSAAELELRDRLSAANPATIEALAGSFPDDLVALETDLDAVLETTLDAPFEESLEAFGLVVQGQRVKYVANVATASDETLQPLYSNISAFITKVLEQEGPEICGQFAITGTQALWDNDLAEKYAEDLDTTSSLYLAAIASGRDAPVTREPAGDVEYGAVFEKMVADGAPTTQIDVIASVDGTNPELCPSLANMMTALGALEGEQGERARATFARELSGY